MLNEMPVSAISNYRRGAIDFPKVLPRHFKQKRKKNPKPTDKTQSHKVRKTSESQGWLDYRIPEVLSLKLKRKELDFFASPSHMHILLRHPLLVFEKGYLVFVVLPRK